MASANAILLDGFKNVTFSSGPAGEPAGSVVWERSTPSDVALIPALVVRTLEVCRNEGVAIFASSEEENKVGVCLKEALQNAVVHGNGEDFSKMVRLELFAGADQWGFIVHDEGEGFDPKSISSALTDETALRDSGRGLHLVSHYIDKVEFFENGRVVVLSKKR